MKRCDTRSWFRPLLTIFGITLLSILATTPATASGVVGDGTAASCTESALQAALDQGGLITFSCGPNAHAINTAEGFAISVEGTIVDGGGLVILDGVNVARPISVLTRNVTLRNLTISSGAKGGIWVGSSAGLILENSLVTGNTNSACGGGIRTEDASSELILQASTIQGNSAPSGGGICAQGPATIRDSSIVENRANGTDERGWGGGMWWRAEPGALLVENSTFHENSAIAGGGLLLSHDGEAILRDSLISGNLALTGGGLFNLADTTLERVTVTGNRAELDGGGLYNDFYQEGFGTGHLTIVASQIRENSAVSGGGYLNETYGEVLDSVFEGNSASDGWGGAIANRGGFLRISRSTLAHNEAVGAQNRPYNGLGGAIHNYVNYYDSQHFCPYTSQPCLEIYDSTLSANLADMSGGALFNVSFSAPVVIWNTTITGNRADADLDGYGEGGGIYNYFVDGTVYLGNSVLADNTESILLPIGWRPTTGECAGALDLFEGTRTLVRNYDHAHCRFNFFLLDQLITADPLLGPLQDNGGLTLTHMPLPGSPAIDAADSDFQPVDQRGAPRPFDGDGDGVALADLGAVEAGALLGRIFQPVALRP